MKALLKMKVYSHKGPLPSTNRTFFILTLSRGVSRTVGRLKGGHPITGKKEAPPWFT